MKRSGSLRRRTPLKPRSAKRERLMVQRRALVAEVLLFRPRCQWPQGCDRPSEDVHEILLRSQGGDILDSRNVLALCRDHHDYAHTHRDEAHRLGVIRRRWAG